MKKEMLINVLQPEECRIAILEDSVLEELYVERTAQESYVGNIYKGRIVNIEPSIQAAFVDFGIGRNGFLHVSDVDPAYYRHLESPRGRGDRERGPRREHDRGPRPDARRDAPPPPPMSAPPPQPRPSAPVADEDRPFGAGLFDDEPTPTPAIAEEASATAVASDAESPADEKKKPRRRRGRRRGKKK